MPEIIITINKEGELVADACNFKGQACMKEISKLLEGIGGEIKTKKKNEFYSNGIDNTNTLKNTI